MAALKGDEQKVASLLAHNPCTIEERSLFGQTPLHLAAGHPACLRVLLRGPGIALLDQPDSVGHTALEYAAKACSGHTKACEASIPVILEFDCRVPNQFSLNLLDLCQACRVELLKHIKNRGERLKRYALERLPGAEAATLGLRQVAVLDSKANLVIKALERRGFEIPSPLRLDAPDAKFYLCQPESMFHLCPLNYLTQPYFDTLFQLGFRDFVESASLQFSPLRSWIKFTAPFGPGSCQNWEFERLEAFLWLIQHGANLWDPMPEETFATTAHCLYGSIPFMTYRNVDQYPENARLRFQSLTRILSSNDVRDGCHCKCSPGGCSPLVWFLRSNLGPRNEFEESLDERKRIIYGFSDFLNGWKPVITVEQTRSAIRYLTFEILEIRHTCSHDRGPYNRGPILQRTEDEIQELMSEDSHLLQLLEELVEEFEIEFRSLLTENDPYGMRFWEVYWPERMEEVMTELNNTRMSENELVSAQRLGVKWHQNKENEDDLVNHGKGRAYRESDWSVEVDDVKMWTTLGSLEDWRSRLELIMSRAYAK